MTIIPIQEDTTITIIITMAIVDAMEEIVELLEEEETVAEEETVEVEEVEAMVVVVEVEIRSHPIVIKPSRKIYT